MPRDGAITLRHGAQERGHKALVVRSRPGYGRAGIHRIITESRLFLQTIERPVASLNLEFPIHDDPSAGNLFLADPERPNSQPVLVMGAA